VVQTGLPQPVPPRRPQPRVVVVAEAQVAKPERVLAALLIIRPGRRLSPAIDRGTPQVRQQAYLGGQANEEREGGRHPLLRPTLALALPRNPVERPLACPKRVRVLE
jgi:hypothetical protein